MPKLTGDFKKQVKALSKADLEKIVLKLAGADRYSHEYINVYFLNPDYGSQDLFEVYKAELEKLAEKNFTGNHPSKRLTKLMKASAQSIRQFRQVVKDPRLEAELTLCMLDIQFEMIPKSSGGYQVYENGLARTLGKLIVLIKEKVHEDYFLEYQGRINGYLLTLHRLFPYNANVRELPRAI